MSNNTINDNRNGNVIVMPRGAFATGSDLVGFLLQLQIAVKMYHWQTTSYGDHIEAGKLYDRIAELSDRLVEEFMGAYSRPRMAAKAAVPVPNMTRSLMLTTLREAITYLQTRVPRDGNLVNVRDELVGELQRAAYMLTMR